jgi:hypothetical protein
MRFLPLTLLLTLIPASLMHAQPAGRGQQESPAAFRARLLDAISHRDVETLATMFKFPVTVRAGGVSLPIGNGPALTRSFDTVFTPELGCALERDTRPTPASLGRGAVQVEPSGASFLITRINEPAGAGAAARRSAPRRVDLPAGQVQFAGTLAAGGMDRYIVAARQGDIIQARVERFQGRAIGVRVVDAGTGRPVSTGSDSARVVSATAQQPADLAVDVTRLTFCDPAVSYLLTISKRR